MNVKFALTYVSKNSKCEISQKSFGQESPYLYGLTEGRTDRRVEEYNGHLQYFFAKAPKRASYRNSAEGYALVSSGSVRGRVGLQVQQKVADFFVSLSTFSFSRQTLLI
jgi:hypothetical protein